MIDEGPNDHELKPAVNIIDSLGVFSKPVEFIVQGISYKTKDEKFSIGSPGLWATAPVYNFVDGFWVGQSIVSHWNIHRKHQLEFEGLLYYTTARKKITWQTNLIYKYRPQLVGKFKIKAGDVSSDYDVEEHVGRLENTIYSLIAGRNFMKLFRKKYIELKNSFYPVPGVRFYQTFSIQWRTTEVNHTTYSFFKTGWDQTNIPDNPYFVLMPYNLALVGSVGFDLTFCKACAFNRKSYEIIYSYIPTLSLKLVFGIPTHTKNSSEFQYLETSVNQRFKFDKNKTFDYKVGGGSFIFKRNLWFPDFKHFGAYGLPSMRTFTNDGFFLIGYYKADTDRYWFKASANYLASRFLLTRIKFFNPKDFNEGVHFRFLWTSDIRNYNEWGYAIGYKDLFRLGFFIGFNNFDYNSWGFTLSFPWLSGSY